MSKYNGPVVSFEKFSTAFRKQFDEMQKAGELYVVDISGDTLWNTYLSSFPEGTNEKYKERAEYDCSCCKNFIRQVGNVVSIKDGKLVSVWDIQPGGYYDIVVDKLSELVKAGSVRSVYRINQKQVTRSGVLGNAKTHGEGLDGKIRTFYHFEVAMQPKLVVSSVGKATGSANELHDMLKTLTTKISLESLEIIGDLISQNSLYRGQEHAQAVKDATKILKEFSKLKPEEKDIWYWTAAVKYGHSVRFRNTAIGKLAGDISDGVDLERAVSSFESMVAPANYKRSSAIVTPKMISAAKDKIVSLGLMDSLERRDATETDISVSNVLFRNRDAAPKAMDVFDDLGAKSKRKQSSKDFDKLESVSMDKFLTDILPRAKSLEVFFDYGKTNRLMTLTTEKNQGSPNLFAWNNPFAWVYNGGVADSNIKDLVKRAGGKVEGDVRVSLSWHNNDDLDLHAYENNRSERIYFGRRHSRAGGELDLDMNGMDGLDKNRQPVENIIYKSAATLNTLDIEVNQYSRRENIDRDFEVEVEILGKSVILKAKKPLTSGTVKVGKIVRSNGTLEFTPNLSEFDIIGGASVEVWGLQTGTFVPVSMVMKSPNFWEGEEGKGNEHIFFMVEGCSNDEKIRGFFNEYLKPELTEHRKVFEMLADTTKFEPSSEQLSGLGFSTTTKEDIIVKVKGSVNRMIKVVL